MSKTAPNLSANDATQKDDEIDLIALLLTLLRGWKTILAFALLGLVLGVTYSRYIQPTYETDALIQIDNKSQGISSGLDPILSQFVGVEATPAQTENELIQSRMVLEPVVKKLHLDIQLNDAELGALTRITQSPIPTQTSNEEGVFLETESGLVHISSFTVPRAYENKNFLITKTNTGFKLTVDVDDIQEEYKGNIGSISTIKTSEGDIKILVESLPTTGHSISLTKLSTPSAIDSLSSNLSISELGSKTGLIKLVLTGEDQQQVSRVLESIVQIYMAQNIARSTEQTTTTIKFMESQIPQLKQKLEVSEKAFNRFREQYGTIDVSKEAEILVSESAQIERQLSELKLKQAELLTYYTAEHPLVVQINDQLAVLNDRRQAIKQTVTRMPEIQREFLQLSQDMNINREIYLTMLKNYEQLKIARAGEIGDVRVVDMPVNTFRPIAPRKLIIWALSLIIGTVLGSLLVLAKSLLRNTIRDPERLEEKTGVPVIANIPRSKTTINLMKKNKNSQHLLAMVDHEGLSYEGIKSLRTSLMLTMPSVGKVASTWGNVGKEETSKQGKIIAISSEAPGIGKSFISSNLAETFSQLNKKVLIIDGDMHRGELHKIFTINQSNGLGDYLTEKNATLDNFIHPTSFEFIDFMPRGQHPNNPASLLSTDKFSNMLVHLVAIYDYIIIDTPPVLAVSDAIIIAQYADKVLMVTRYNHSVEGQLAYAIKQVHKANVTVDGIVLNDVVQGITSKYSYAYGNSKD